MKESVQEISIYIDDSGVLHSNEKCSVYGGIAFISQESKKDFMKKYQRFLYKIRCYYCQKNVGTCQHICPEIKDTMIKNIHKMKIFQLLQNEFCFAVIIDHNKVEKQILSKKSSRGRFRDYTERILIKRILQKMIKDHQIDPYQPLKLSIRIDNQVNILHIERNFLEDLTKEFTKGMINLKYFINYPPILHANLTIDLKYVNSKNHVLIQCADIIAGEVRKHFIAKNLNQLTFLKLVVYMP